MAELYLIRHGQASFGQDDYDQLSDLGLKQSELLGQYFLERNVVFDCVVTGDMKRHKQTADGILSFANLDGERSTHAGWNEFDFESLIKAYLVANPEHTPSKDAPRAVYYKLLKLAMKQWSLGNLQDGLPETWDAFVGRVIQARVDSTKPNEHNNKKRILVSTSGGAIAITLMTILGLSPEQAIDFNLQIKNTSIHHFYFSNNSFQLSTFNSVSHLDTIERQKLITYS